MRLVSSLRVVVVMFAGGAGMVLARAGAARPATASHPPGWRIAKIIRRAHADYDPLSIAAASARDAWIAGVRSPIFQGRVTLDVEHWNGAAWVRLATPAVNPGSALGPQAIVGASRAGGAWVFAPAPGLGLNPPPKPTASTALHWNGRRWITYRLARGTFITATAVLSDTDAWAFGWQALRSVQRPYAIR